MREGFDLGQFLEQARAHGAHSSEGSFTIAQDRALDKLAHFSLAGENDWVLKIVQAANAWGCDSLHLRQTRVATSFFFNPAPETFPSDSEIVNALKHGSGNSVGPIHDLCMALRALVDQAKLSFVLATFQNGEKGHPIYFGDDVSRLASTTRNRWADLAIEGIRLTVSHFRGGESFSGRYLPTFSKVARRHLSIVQVLYKRAFCSPTRILIDGIDISNPFRHPRYGQDLLYRPLALGRFPSRETPTEEFHWTSCPAKAPAAEFQRPKATREQNSTWCFLRTLEWTALKELRSARIRGNRTKIWRFNKTISSMNEYFWLRHGVVVARQIVGRGTEGTSLFVVLPGNDLRSDLTGLSVRLESPESELLFARTERLRSELKTLQQKVPHLARTVATRAELQVMEVERLPTVQDLDAGYSIFTEGLLSRSAAGRPLTTQWQLNWRNFWGSFEQTKRLQEWEAFVQGELDALRNALQLQPRSENT